MIFICFNQTNECPLCPLSVPGAVQVLSGFNSIVLARVFRHADVAELNAEANVPVINALSDLHHPLQTLADLMTMKARYQQNAHPYTRRGRFCLFGWVREIGCGSSGLFALRF